MVWCLFALTPYLCGGVSVCVDTLFGWCGGYLGGVVAICVDTLVGMMWYLKAMRLCMRGVPMHYHFVCVM